MVHLLGGGPCHPSLHQHPQRSFRNLLLAHPFGASPGRAPVILHSIGTPPPHINIGYAYSTTGHTLPAHIGGDSLGKSPWHDSLLRPGHHSPAPAVGASPWMGACHAALPQQRPHRLRSTPTGTPRGCISPNGLSHLPTSKRPRRLRSSPIGTPGSRLSWRGPFHASLHWQHSRCL